MSENGERPALRALIRPVPYAAPGVGDGQLFLLEDPLRFSDQLAVVPAAGLAVLQFLDGTRSLKQVLDAFELRYGFRPPADQAEQLVEQMRAAHLLEGPEVAAFVDAFAQRSDRDPACIGSYPGEPDELSTFLQAAWTREGGPGAPPQEDQRTAPVRGLISPHIDMHRGGHSYAWGWREIAESCTADVFVVFGTSHTGTAPIHRPGPPARYALTGKTYKTPIGEVPTDAALLQRLVEVYDGPDDLFAGEIHHRIEHSIEFQAVYLAHLFAQKRAITILPVLCGNLADAEQPSQDEGFAAFHRALREALAPLPPERVAFVAGIDFDHVGVQFGEPPVDADALERMQSADRKTLGLALEGRDPDAVHEDIVSYGEQRSICGHSALVGFLEAMRDESLSSELLHYDFWEDGQSAVSFASAVYRREDA